MEAKIVDNLFISGQDAEIGALMTEIVYCNKAIEGLYELQDDPDREWDGEREIYDEVQVLKRRIFKSRDKLRSLTRVPSDWRDLEISPYYRAYNGLDVLDNLYQLEKRNAAAASATGAYKKPKIVIAGNSGRRFAVWNNPPGLDAELSQNDLEQLAKALLDAAQELYESRKTA